MQVGVYAARERDGAAIRNPVDEFNDVAPVDAGEQSILPRGLHVALHDALDLGQRAVLPLVAFEPFVGDSREDVGLHRLADRRALPLRRDLARLLPSRPRLCQGHGGVAPEREATDLPAVQAIEENPASRAAVGDAQRATRIPFVEMVGLPLRGRFDAFNGSGS